MKTLIIFFLILSGFSSLAQDTTPIVINLRDNSKLQFNSNPVKMKGTVLNFTLLADKEWRIVVLIKYYESVAGAYGTYIPTTISADATLSAEEKETLLQTYADKYLEWSTAGHFCDASGNIVAQGTGGATTELTYWQTFRLNQVAGVGTAASTGALEAQYLTIAAIVNKLNARKRW